MRNQGRTDCDEKTTFTATNRTEKILKQWILLRKKESEKYAKPFPILWRKKKELINKKGGVRKVLWSGLYIKFIPVPDNEEWFILIIDGEDSIGGLSIQIPTTPLPPEGDKIGTDYIELHNQWMRHGGMLGHDGQISSPWYPTEEQIEALRHYLKAIRSAAPDDFKPHEQPPGEVLAWSKVKWLEGILEAAKA